MPFRVMPRVTTLIVFSTFSTSTFGSFALHTRYAFKINISIRNIDSITKFLIESRRIYFIMPLSPFVLAGSKFRLVNFRIIDIPVYIDVQKLWNPILLYTYIIIFLSFFTLEIKITYRIQHLISILLLLSNLLLLKLFVHVRFS